MARLPESVIEQYPESSGVLTHLNSEKQSAAHSGGEWTSPAPLLTDTHVIVRTANLAPPVASP